MVRTTKREYLERIRLRYRRAGKRHKSKILDEFCAVCGYNRKYAIGLLAERARGPRKKPGPRRRYGPELDSILRQLWLACEQICGKRLRQAIPLWLPYYERHQGALDPAVRQQLLSISASSLDRRLRPIRARYPRGKRCGTKPGSLLKQHIPVRTHNWDVTQPGFVEADTVAHCGGSMEGSFVWSLTFTDIFSGWTLNRAVWNKGARDVVRQIKELERRLPFPLLGFDSDNGSEFLNWHLYRLLQQRKQPVGWTRAREYRKNDNAHVEQKNWTHVRQLLGYDRIDKPEAVAAIDDLYDSWCDLQNFFMPSIKLLSKQREGSKIHRRYERPTTPYQRLLASPAVPPGQRARLQAHFQGLDPFQLKQDIERKLRRVFPLNQSARPSSPPVLHFPLRSGFPVRQ